MGLVVSAMLGIGASVAGARANSGSGADLSVTSPPDPIPAAPGTLATTTLIVGNLGSAALDVQISSQRVVLLDNGSTRFDGRGTDPHFVNRISIAPKLLTLPPHQERKVKISAKVPKGLAPNDYFLGFLVSPVINSSSVTVQNDIGALVIIDVPGPRHIRLVGSFVGLPSVAFSLSSSASGFVRTKNVGTATVQYSTTDETHGWPSLSSAAYLTFPPRLLPPGLYREFPVHLSSWLGLGWYTIHTTFVYDRTQQSTGEVTLSRTILIVNPLWFLVAPAAGLSIAWGRRRRRRLKAASKSQRGRKSPPKHSASGLRRSAHKAGV
jgi:hypothetical protein